MISPSRRKGSLSAEALNVNDRVVYLTQSGSAEPGCVRWIGKLPNYGRGFSTWVGVEFDNPVGQDSVSAAGRSLFKAPPKRAGLLRIEELVRSEDFYEVPAEAPSSAKCADSGESRSRKGEVVLAADARYGSECDDINAGFRARQPSSSASSSSPSLSSSFAAGSAEDRFLPEEDRTSSLSLSPQLFAVSSDASTSGSGSYSGIGPAKMRKDGKYQIAEESSNKIRGGILRRGVAPPVASPPETDLINLRAPSGSVSASVSNASVMLSNDVTPPASLVQSPVGASARSPSPPPLPSGGNSPTASTSASAAAAALPPTLSRGPSRHGEILEVGCLVEVCGWFKDVFYGVIRWIGYVDDPDLDGQLMAGLEAEDEDERFSDGIFNGKRYFYCAPQRALFLPLAKCQRDRRFSSQSSPRPNMNLEADCVVPGAVPPLQTFDRLCGRYRGIQGHLNSCYLDATLFAMFTYSCVFDSVLYRPPKSCDIEEYGELQAILRDEIVNPLRKYCYVKANHVMRLRYMLDKCSRVEGLVSEEKDPEEFLQSLLSDTLQAEPLIRLSTGQEAFMYQLVVEKDERLALPTVQQLFDQSFLSSSLKFREVPPCLIIQMPRCGPSFKMYARIQPSMALDITDALLDAPRACHFCGTLAEVECTDCYDVQEGLESTAFCRPCLTKVHSHRKRLDHESRHLNVSPEARDYFSPVFSGGGAGSRRGDPPHHAPMSNGQRASSLGLAHFHGSGLHLMNSAGHLASVPPGYAPPPTPPRVLMELFAVVCIQTSHYVAFVKAGSGAEAPWCFFDSMADRSGEDNGYNIPEVVPCPGLHRWLSEERIPEVLSVKDEKLLPEHARRLLCDAYLCFYQSHDTLMYR